MQKVGNKNIGIYYICTGTYKSMFQDFLDSLNLFEPNSNKTIILLCDSNDIFYKTKLSVKQYYIPDQPWPLVTLLKMSYINKYKIDNTDYIYYFNANCQIKKEIFIKDYDILVTLPPDWNNNNFSYLPIEDDCPYSNSYIGLNKYNYIQGGLFGGKSDIIYKMCNDIDNWIIEDLKLNIIPKWHDETYLNKWIYINRNNYNIYYSNYFSYKETIVALILNKSFIPKKDNNLPRKYLYSDIYNTFKINKVTKMKTKVSIIITAYNVASFIEECVESVENQTYKNIDVFIVEDVSTDNTKGLLEYLKNKYSNITLVYNETNVGAGNSRYNGIQASIEKSDSEYILLLDGDDWLTPTFIEDLVKKAEETGADIVSGGITVDKGDGVKEMTSYGNVITEGPDKVFKFWKEKIVFMNNKIIRKSIHKQVPYCKRRYIEDTPVIIPQLYFANIVAYVDNPGYVYRMRTQSLTHEATEFKNALYRALCVQDLIRFFKDKDQRYLDFININKAYMNEVNTMKNTINESELLKYMHDYIQFSINLMYDLNTDINRPVEPLKLENILIKPIPGSGLGNLLFNIAFALKLKTDQNIVLDNIDYGFRSKLFKEFIKLFKLENEFSYTDITSPSMGQLIKNLDIHEPISFNVINKNIILNGYFQEKPSDELIEKLKSNLIKEDLINDYIVVHIRRGDFLDTNNSDIHTTTPKEYYINEFKKYDKSTKFIIISDDIDWCKENFKEDNIEFSNNTFALDDFKLLLGAKSIIFGNSTFAYWGSILNINPECKVTCSNDWYKQKELNNKLNYLIPNNWTLI